ncbi:MAG: hypothetical protein II776_05685, partial [Clostridia bacterium]|nr:hypothetical protein [Clostridia bacterium]
MQKLWAGRASGEINAAADSFNSSISFDQKMIRQDICGSMAHASMLAAVGILTPEEGEGILAGLERILADLEEGKLEVDPQAEDVHSFVEATLTARLGDLGRKLHTARSRNDQVALDVRLYLREEAGKIRGQILSLLEALLEKAEAAQDLVMPGYTHLQRAQPVTFAHHLLAYAQMFRRDLSWLDDALARMNKCPLGACALAGTTFPIDREMTARALPVEIGRGRAEDGQQVVEPTAQGGPHARPVRAGDEGVQPFGQPQGQPRPVDGIQLFPQLRHEAVEAVRQLFGELDPVEFVHEPGDGFGQRRE